MPGLLPAAAQPVAAPPVRAAGDDGPVTQPLASATADHDDRRPPDHPNRTIDANWPPDVDGPNADNPRTHNGAAEPATTSNSAPGIGRIGRQHDECRQCDGQNGKELLEHDLVLLRPEWPPLTSAPRAPLIGVGTTRASHQRKIVHGSVAARPVVRHAVSRRECGLRRPQRSTPRPGWARERDRHHDGARHLPGCSTSAPAWLPPPQAAARPSPP